MTRLHGAIGIVAFALAGLPARAAEPGAPDLRTPLAAVDRGRVPSAAEIDAVAEASGAPVVCGDELAASLRLADTGTAGEPDALRASHAAAIEAFFAGDQRVAVAQWTAASDALAARPGLMARDPLLRRVAFESRLYLALAARGSQDEAGAERWLEAAVDLDDLAPPTEEFPPWVRERLAQLRGARPEPDGKLVFGGAAGCELWVDGRRVGSGPGTYAAKRGLHAVHSRCDGRASLVREVVATGYPIAVDAPTMRRGAFRRGDGAPRLVVDDGAADAEIAEDVFALARAAGASRAIAVVGSAAMVEIWIVDEVGIVRRSEANAGDLTALAGGARRLAAGDLARLPERGDPVPPRPWYRDGAAWALVASGLAIWGTGLAVGRAYGSPSRQESAAWAMMAGGAVAAGTGVVLFFVPPAPSSDGSGADSGALVGAAAGWRF
jgi:hypothetical protein